MVPFIFGGLEQVIAVKPEFFYKQQCQMQYLSINPIQLRFRNFEMNFVERKKE